MSILLPFKPIVAWGVDRVKKNKNLIIIINGGTGSGKTYAGIDLALLFAQALGTSFTIKGNMDFNFNNLLKKSMLPENKKPGTVFLFEEVGATGGGASSREWQNRENINFNSFMQTARHRNQIIIMTCPDFAYLEKGTRKLVHMQMIMKGINYHIKRSYAKCFANQCNPTTGKIYSKFLRVSYKGKMVKVSQMEFRNPPKDIITEYEALKEQYTQSLYAGMIEEKEKGEKIIIKTSLQCPDCNYEWKSKEQHPKRCPNCYKYFKNGHFPKEINAVAVVTPHV